MRAYHVTTRVFVCPPRQERRRALGRLERVAMWAFSAIAVLYLLLATVS